MVQIRGAVPEDRWPELPKHISGTTYLHFKPTLPALGATPQVTLSQQWDPSPKYRECLFNLYLFSAILSAPTSYTFHPPSFEATS